ncbi:RCC1 domain-containing protein, partial [Bifidobacterium favimelis]
APAGFTWKQATTGDYHSAALGSDGNLYAWGVNDSRQLGDGTDTSSNTPVKAKLPDGAPAGFTWKQADYGAIKHSLALGSDGNLYAWGNNVYGQLGDGTSDVTNNGIGHPVTVRFGQVLVTAVRFDKTPSQTAPVRQENGTWLVTAPAHTRGSVDFDVDSTLNGETTTTKLKYEYVPPSHTVRFDPAGGKPSPAEQDVLEGDQATRPLQDPTRSGWHFNGWFDGELAYDFNQPVTGNLTLTAHWTPEARWTTSPKKGPNIGGDRVTLTPPAPDGTRFSSIRSGLAHSLALGSDGNLYAWGQNMSGQLGDGTDWTTAAVYRTTPVMVKPPADAPAGFTWKQAAAGNSHSLAFGSDGNLYAWGANESGQLGDGT